MSKCSLWPIDRTLHDTTIPGQNRPGCDSNKGILSIPQSLWSTGASSLECLISYPGRSLVRGLTPLERCNWCILLPQHNWLNGDKSNSDRSDEIG